jgi:hypothetical protein
MDMVNEFINQTFVPQAGQVAQVEGIEDMFGTQTESTERTAAQLADFIVREETELDQIEEAFKKRKANLEAVKTQLANLLIQSGLESIKLEGGLSPKAKIVRKYFKAAGVDDEQLFGWLKEQSLDGIIKPTVHYQTLQSTLKEFEAQGNEIPAIFNVTDTPTVTMYGKSKYMAAQFLNSTKN